MLKGNSVRFVFCLLNPFEVFSFPRSGTSRSHAPAWERGEFAARLLSAWDNVCYQRLTEMEYGEDIKAAKLVIKMFLKARKNIRMYPANNPVYVNTLKDTFEKFKVFFSFKDRLVLNIRLHDIYYGEELIYHNNEQKDDNLAFFFFKDGLRELTFQ